MYPLRTRTEGYLCVTSLVILIWFVASSSIFTDAVCSDNGMLTMQTSFRYSTSIRMDEIKPPQVFVEIFIYRVCHWNQCNRTFYLHAPSSANYKLKKRTYLNYVLIMYILVQPTLIFVQIAVKTY